jgi:hypothetical protein
VVVGENTTVEARVTNEGDVGGTQEVTFAVDGERQGGERVTLAGGENVTLAFSYETETGDRPEVEVAVASENETATAAVEVSAPASFAVAIDTVDDAVTIGENLTVTARVANEGDVTGTQEVAFAVDGGREGGERVTVAPGANETVTFAYETVAADRPAVNLTVASENGPSLVRGRPHRGRGLGRGRGEPDSNREGNKRGHHERNSGGSVRGGRWARGERAGDTRRRGERDPGVQLRDRNGRQTGGRGGGGERERDGDGGGCGAGSGLVRGRPVCREQCRGR